MAYKKGPKYKGPRLWNPGYDPSPPGGRGGPEGGTKAGNIDLFGHGKKKKITGKKGKSKSVVSARKSVRKLAKPSKVSRVASGSSVRRSRAMTTSRGK